MPHLPSDTVAPEGLRAVPPVTVQAFSADSGARKTFGRAFADRRLRRVAATIHEGGIEMAIGQFAAAPTPDLLIIDLEREHKDVFTALDRLADVCDPDTRVLLIGRKNDVALYRSLMQWGVSDYLVHPVSGTQIAESVTRLFVDPAAPRVGRLIACYGARGGAGSSSVARHLAGLLARTTPHEVLLVDADLAFGTAALALDQEPDHTLADALFSNARPDLKLVERLVHRAGRNLALLAAPARLDRHADPSPETLLQVLELAQQVSPLVVVDLPHHWSGLTRDVLKAADEVVITTTPDLTALRNLRELGTMLGTLRSASARGHLVVNRLKMPGHADVAERDLVAAFGTPVAARLRYDGRLFSAMELEGQPLVQIAPRHRLLKALGPLVTALTSRHKAVDAPVLPAAPASLRRAG